MYRPKKKASAKFGASFCHASGKVAYTKKDAETMRNFRLSGRKESWNQRGPRKKAGHGRPEFLRIYPCGNHWHLTSTK